MSANCCPVCCGKGIVPNGFYGSVGKEWTSSSASPEVCKLCKGTGVVWDTQEIVLDEIYALAGVPVEQVRHIPLLQFIKTRFVTIEEYNALSDELQRLKDKLKYDL